MKMLHPTAQGAVQVVLPDGTTLLTDAVGKVTVPDQYTSELLDIGYTIVTQTDRLPMVAGRWYTQAGGDTFAAVLSLTGKINAHPVYVPNRVLVKQLGVFVTTQQAASFARCGIYLGADGAPTALLAAGDIDTATAGSRTVTLTNPVVLDPGWYWLASAFTSPGTFPSVNGVTAAGASGVSHCLGSTTAGNALSSPAANSASGVIADFTYAALPAAFPTTNYGLQVNVTTPAVALGL